MRTKNAWSYLTGYFSLVLCLAGPTVTAQQILLDQPVRAGQLTVFPDIGNKKDYYYLPNKVRIASDATGKPGFSFLRYVQNVNNPAAENQEGEGGGIVHAVVELYVTDDQLAEARSELRKINSEGVIRGPVIYSGGTIALISSFAQAGSDLTQTVLGLGKAPILEGNKAAVSVRLTKLGAKILWESFQTPTPDMSISFEMDLKGYRSPKRVLIEANFDQVYQNQTFQAAAAVHGPVLLAAEINQSFEDLRKSGAIKVTQIGEDEKLEKALETAYTKLTNLMFDPAQGTGTPSLGQLTSTATGNQSMLDRVTKMLNDARDKADRENTAIRRENREILAGENTPRTAETNDREITVPEDDSFRDDVEIGPERNTANPERGVAGTTNRVPRQPLREEVTRPTMAVMASYQMKTVHQQGEFRIDLNKYTTDNLTIRFDENFGQIRCQECFRQVNLDDPLFRQREIYSSLDGFNSSDFGSYINFVTVTLRKKHENGDITNEEIRIDKSNFNQTGNNFKMVYGWKQDNNRLLWLNYDYKTMWNYFGGYSAESEWMTSSLGSIPMSSPVLRRVVDVEADPDILKKSNVRSVEVKIWFTLGDKEQLRLVKLNPRTGQLSQQIDLLMPSDNYAYKYEITWFLSDGTTKGSGKKPGNSSILYADTL
jgi:hypothetical protein